MFIRRTNTETPVFWPTDAKSCLIRNDPGSWERLEAGREGDDRGQDGWMASSTLWTWVWGRFMRCWRTRKLGMLQSMGSQSQTQLDDFTTTALRVWSESESHSAVWLVPWAIVHGIPQARIMEWVDFPSFLFPPEETRGSSQPRDQTQVSCTAGRFFTSWATREAQQQPSCHDLEIWSLLSPAVRPPTIFLILL